MKYPERCRVQIVQDILTDNIGDALAAALGCNLSAACICDSAVGLHLAAFWIDKPFEKANKTILSKQNDIIRDMMSRLSSIPLPRRLPGGVKPFEYIRSGIACHLSELLSRRLEN
ncbi:hypothetical protein HGRIS_006439 [Hohenbuehelia grisea]|uniref:Uncharacterized protein n=1 Tax=Hohenbuehelia grisea TaxID=104357 RepID=A0ABR3K071_9AGAR